MYQADTDPSFDTIRRTSARAELSIVQTEERSLARRLTSSRLPLFLLLILVLVLFLPLTLALTLAVLLVFLLAALILQLRTISCVRPLPPPGIRAPPYLLSRRVRRAKSNPVGSISDEYICEGVVELDGPGVVTRCKRDRRVSPPI